MKNVLAICTILFCLPLIAFSQSINGTGDIVKEEIELSSLSGVELGFSGDIILTQGSSQKIVMEGQRNILDNIKRDVSGGVWNVDFEKNVREAKPVKIYITMASLKVVGLTGSGNISSTNTFQNGGDLKIDLSGSGEIHLSVNAGIVDSDLSGSGDIVLKGSATSVKADISGSGDINASEMKSGDCKVAISGSGNASVYCTTSVEGSISGSGDVMYKGNAAKVKSSITGSGDIREIH